MQFSDAAQYGADIIRLITACQIQNSIPLCAMGRIGLELNQICLKNVEEVYRLAIVDQSTKEINSII